MNMPFDFPLLAAVPALPLILATLGFIVRSEETIRRLLPLPALLALIAPLIMPADSASRVYWFFMGSSIGLEPFSQIFLTFSAFIWLLTGCVEFSPPGPLSNKTGRGYLPCLFVAMSGNFGLILARDLLGFYLFFVLMSLSGYGLIVADGRPDSRRAGRLYLIMVILSEVCIFAGFALLSGQNDGLAPRPLASKSLCLAVLLCLYAGFGIKIAALPFHAWILPAYERTPAPAAAALAGPMAAAGILGWLRFLQPAAAFAPGAYLFLGAGGIAVFYGVLLGLRQTVGSRILACSSISQHGLLTVITGFFLLQNGPADEAASLLILFTLHHSLCKSSLFLGAHALRRSQAGSRKLLWPLLLVPSLALAGLPGTSGGIAKTALKSFLGHADTFVPFLLYLFLPLSSFATTVLLAHFLVAVGRQQESDRPGKLAALPFAAGVLAVFIAPILFPAFRTTALHSLSAPGILSSLVPIIAGLMVAYLARDNYRFTKFFSPQHRLLQVSTSGENFLSFLWRRLIALQELDLRVLHHGHTLWRHWQADMKLRKAEKVLGRWTAIGLCYLLLLFIFFFLSH